jgi:hypothetical protein
VSEFSGKFMKNISFIYKFIKFNLFEGYMAMPILTELAEQTISEHNNYSTVRNKINNL